MSSAGLQIEAFPQEVWSLIAQKVTSTSEKVTAATQAISNLYSILEKATPHSYGCPRIFSCPRSGYIPIPQEENPSVQKVSNLVKENLPLCQDLLKILNPKKRNCSLEDLSSQTWTTYHNTNGFKNRFRSVPHFTSEENLQLCALPENYAHIYSSLTSILKDLKQVDEAISEIEDRIALLTQNLQTCVLLFLRKSESFFALMNRSCKYVHYCTYSTDMCSTLANLCQDLFTKSVPNSSFEDWVQYRINHKTPPYTLERFPYLQAALNEEDTSLLIEEVPFSENTSITLPSEFLPNSFLSTLNEPLEPVLTVIKEKRRSLDIELDLQKKTFYEMHEE